MSIINCQFPYIARFTLIVYFISAFCGWFNLIFAKLNSRIYFPLRSYLISFSNNEVTNFKEDIFNLAGYKTVINTSIPYKIIDDVFFTIICTLLILLFYLGYKKVKSNKVSQGEIIKWSIIFSVIMTFSIPSHSSDLYGYIARGAQQTLYNQNPYLNTISEIQEYDTNPSFFNFMWPKQPTTYGPVFIYITKLTVLLSNNNFFVSLINFKLLNLTFFLLLILFVLKLNDSKNTYLLTWNPLILIQGLWNGHNDLLSGVLIFLGVYLLMKSNYFWSIFCLIVAGGIKYVSFLAIPLLFFHCLKNKVGKNVYLNIILGLFSGFLLILIFSIDYFSTIDINRLASNIDLTHKSFISTVFTIIKYLNRWQNLNLDMDFVLVFLKCVFYIGFLLIYLFILIRKKSNVIFDITFILFVFLGFTIAKFHSWYLLNVIVLIPFLGGEVPGSRLLRKLLITLSMSHVFAITFLDQAKILNFISMTLLPILFVFWKEKRKE